ncbi:MAG: corrinoid protein [Candidatus Bathyarchaeia archaeon]
MPDILDELATRLRDLDLDGTIELTNEALKRGFSASEILSRGLSKGMDGVGDLFERKEYFLADLVTASYILDKAMVLLKEKLAVEAGKAEYRGKVVFGTVQGDLHDIGKNIAIALLKASGFEVVDLGVDVPAEAFVEAVRRHKPDIVAMSALLLTTLPGMGEVINALREASLREEVFVMIGGRPTSNAFAKMIGADAYCATAMDGVKKASEFIKLKFSGGTS